MFWAACRTANVFINGFAAAKWLDKAQVIERQSRKQDRTQFDAVDNSQMGIPGLNLIRRADEKNAFPYFVSDGPVADGARATALSSGG